MKTRSSRLLLLSVLTIAMSFEAQTVTINVTSLADTIADDGVCTFHEAVAAANTDAVSGATPGECVAGSGFDTIDFPLPLPAGTIAINPAGITMTSSMEIRGPFDRSMTFSGGVLIFDDGATTTQSVTIRQFSFVASATPIRVIENVLLDGCTLIGPNNVGNGIFVHPEGSLVVSNSTITGFTSGLIQGRGVELAGGSAVLLNTTVWGNQVGVTGSGRLVLSNTVLAGSSVTDCGGSLDLDLGHGNFFEDASCDGTADGDPLLTGLAANGGPTMTFGLQLGSPLRDAGEDGLCLMSDQRGAARAADGDGVSGARCDIGSVEVSDPGSTVVALESFEIE